MVVYLHIYVYIYFILDIDSFETIQTKLIQYESKRQRTQRTKQAKEGRQFLALIPLFQTDFIMYRIDKGYSLVELKLLSRT